MALSGSIALQLQGILSTTRDLGAASCTETLSQRVTITDGSTANKATQVWGDTRTLGNGANEELDLNGSLTNGVGATVSFTRVIAIGISAAAANTSTITVGGASSNAWEPWAGASGDKIKIRPGGCLMLTAPDATGLAVTAGTADLLKILNDAAGATAAYSLIIMGS